MKYNPLGWMIEVCRDAGIVAPAGIVNLELDIWLGPTIALVAEEELAAGAREVGENNAGHWVDKYKRSLGYPGDYWCAWATSWCVERAAQLCHVPMPVPPGPKHKNWRSAKRLSRGLVEAGGVIVPRTELPQRGDIPLYERGLDGDYKGHTSVVLGSQREEGLYDVCHFNLGRFPARVHVRTEALGDGTLRLIHCVRI